MRLFRKERPADAKSPSLAARVAAVDADLAALEARRATAAAAWEGAVIDGEVADRQATRKALKAIEYEEAELWIQREALVKALRAAEAEELERATATQRLAIMQRYRELGAEHEERVQDYTLHAEGIVRALEGLSEIDEEGAELLRAADAGGWKAELTRLLPTRPGTVPGVGKLHTHESLTHLPRIVEGRRAIYILHQEQRDAKRALAREQAREREAEFERQRALGREAHLAEQAREAAEKAERKRQRDEAAMRSTVEENNAWNAGPSRET